MYIYYNGKYTLFATSKPVVCHNILTTTCGKATKFSYTHKVNNWLKATNKYSSLKLL